YGYRLSPEKNLVIHDEEALLIRKVFRMYANGREGADTITRSLNDSGHRRRSGRKWDRRVILTILKNPVYMGKIRWKQKIHDGHHEPIISKEVYSQAQKILGERTIDLGSRRQNAAERLLTGRIRCTRCRSNMVGVSTRKNGVKIPYYLCTKRSSTHECDQDYVRADHLEEFIIQDLRNTLRDEELMGRIWSQANDRLSAKKPDLENEVQRIEADLQKVRSAIDRYFTAFEAGDMEPAICNAKVKDLTARQEALEAELKNIEARREQLELPALEQKTLHELVEHFDRVMAHGTNPQKKHLLHQLVKKVLVSDRDTVEVWYFLPDQTSVRTTTKVAPLCCQSSNRDWGAAGGRVSILSLHARHKPR
ncbi:MAG: recombinase family protein, partial [Leptospirillia bacterium]